MTTAYEELQGSFGRTVLYRSERHRVRDLFSPQAQIQVSDGLRQYPVFDVSTSGLCLTAPEDAAQWPVGRQLDLELFLHGRSTQQLRARVARVEVRGSKMRVGLSLTQSFLDLQRAVRFDEEQRLAERLKHGPDAHIRLLPAGFRIAVSDIVYHMQHYRRSLEPHEAPAREQGETAVRELADRAYQSIAPRYAQLRSDAAGAIASHLDDPQIVRAAKEYTETTLTPLLTSAPMVDRAYRKPLGYPGDYQVMLHYYADAYEGSTAFSKAIHRIFVRHPLSAGVPTRKDFVVEQMARHFAALRQSGSLANYRVLSLGCGPAREVSDFVGRQQHWTGQIEFQLIDQDARALEVAQAGAARALSLARGAASVQCLNLGFSRLFTRPSLLLERGRQDFIYCTGLFDYLRTPIASQLLETLYTAMAPGAQLLVGNAAGPNQHFFCPEFVLDWSLLYRTREQMLELTAGLPDEANVNVALEPGEAYFFADIRKPVGGSHT